MKPNPFEERYLTFSTEKLIAIVANKRDYDYLAVEAAKKELAKREVSEIEDRISKAQKRTIGPPKNYLQEGVKYAADMAYNTLFKPIEGEEKANAIIKRISILLGLLFLLSAYGQWSLIEFIINNTDEWEFPMFYSLIGLIIPLMSGYLLWRYKRNGWLLLCAYSSYNVYSFTMMFFYSIKQHGSSVPWLDELCPINCLFWLAFWGAILLSIGKKEVRKIYSVSPETMIYWVVGPVVVVKVFEWLSTL